MRFGGAVSNIGIGDEEISLDVRRFWELFAQNPHEAAQVLGRQMAASVPAVIETGFDYNEGSGGEKKNAAVNNWYVELQVCDECSESE